MDKNERSYTNGEITVHWKPRECVHAGTCFRELRSVFDPSRRPWIDISQASTDAIIDIVERCPTDALTYERNTSAGAIEGQTSTKPPQAEKVSFNIMRNGPILAEGSLTVVKPDGSTQEIKSITSFCRCGLSKKQPFCDGTHNKAGFAPDN
ncbi:MAG: hypothetical protein CVU09_04955 [Bacteroidetes bacterium HGW-Bacteroidetes-4]|jgi:uncharacterized Fe-S cluster protein YjdI|nr:MAG: hypothetical protein CVU09_04955 [Bacteroidetes bacterium HGW-Bacteroidetes-4]